MLVKLTHVVKFTNILRPAFSVKCILLKSTNLRFVYKNLPKKLLYKKTDRKLLVKMTTGDQGSQTQKSMQDPTTFITSAHIK